MGVRAARRRPRAVAQGADRRRRRNRDAGNRASGTARRVCRNRRRPGGRGNGFRGASQMMRRIRSAFVIARRDFSATVLSKTFLFFLLGPLFPLLLGGAFGSIGARVASRTETPLVAVVSSQADYARLAAARERVAAALGDPG